MTKETFRERIKREIGEAGGAEAWAKAQGFTVVKPTREERVINALWPDQPPWWRMVQMGMGMDVVFPDREKPQ